jgi:hypothetical protein
MRRYTLADLKRLPTLSTGQADDLKIDDGNERVWLSRCTVEDGEPYDNKVTIERIVEGCWQTVTEYEAK